MNEQIVKAAHAQQMYDQRDVHLGHLPGPILRDIARNDSAPREWRRAAVELMLDRKCPEVNHPDLAELLREVKAQREAKDEVQSIVESAIEQPLEDDTPAPGPFVASFTTKNF
jgi:hypothetical protein